ncbi:MAG: GatB/YqeY domain-containing protein [candidate division KSB1 bacterium]|jgi:uncharacterized protein YqeY|nr:GatB/YqeY domain-containing protein [candidate division KSB1 bacterium]
MSLLEKITADMKSAMKSQDKAKLNALRLLISDLKYARISSKEELTDEQEMAVILSAAKKRKESIESYKTGGRDDLLAKEEQELKIISEYLPEQISEEQVIAEIDSVITETGASSIKDLGRVMGLAMKKLKGRADGSLVQEIVRRKLA